MHLDLKSFAAVDELYWQEYLLLMKAAALRELDKERDIYLSAYLREIAGQRKRQGKATVPVYKTFNDFYDYKKRRKKLLQEKPAEHEQRLIDIIVQANEL